MTIPTRPAPPPPIYSGTSSSQQRSNRGGVDAPKLLIKLPPPSMKPQTTQNSFSTNSITRHFPKAKVNTDLWQMDLAVTSSTKGPAPPRPPPPKTAPPSVLKKPNSPPTSVNIVSNLFGKKKGKPAVSIKPDVKQSKTSFSSSHVNPLYNSAATTPTPVTKGSSLASSASSDLELISFDLPSASSPTFTQKSNSDCVSVDSFSSDSNFSSPNNGHGSQPESGFEDDFSTSRATTSPADPWETLEEVFSNAKENIYSNNSISTAPLRNYDIVKSRVQAENTLCNGKSLIPPAPSLSMPTIIKPKISQKPKAPKPPAIKSNNVPLSYTCDAEVEDPPMPSFAPPPPPPFVAVQSQPIEEFGGPYGIALYDFQSFQEGDLPFKENDKIYILRKVNDEWFYGRNKSGCEGMFPANYIDVRVPLQETASSSNSPLLSTSEEIRALYTFIAQEDGDLTFYENDVVTVLNRINEDWLYGEVGGRRGQFPSNFLEHPPKNV